MIFRKKKETELLDLLNSYSLVKLKYKIDIYNAVKIQLSLPVRKVGQIQRTAL